MSWLICRTRVSTNQTDPSLLQALLMARWRFPSLSVHSITSSGGSSASVIPNSACSQLSIRIVPDQQSEAIVASLRTMLNNAWQLLGSPNRLTLNIEERANWWLSDPENAAFKALEDAIHAEWNIMPLYIREGGSIPAIRWLEVAFGARAVHFPMGMSSDQAHLANERIPLVNLFKGKNILKRVFTSL